MNYVNIITGEEPSVMTDRIGTTINPTWDQLRNAGWRYKSTLEPVQTGFERGPILWVEGDDGNYARAIYQDTLIQDRLDREAAAKLETLTPEIIRAAALFRALLRRNFGDGAETNREITSEAVLAHFAGLTLAQTITAQQSSDGVLLKELFSTLSGWTGTGETWSFPWELVP